MEEEIKNSQLSESILDSIETCYEKESKMSEEKANDLSEMVQNPEEFTDCVRAFKDQDNTYKEAINKCDENIKAWQESKKMWQERQNDLKGIITKIMKRFQLKNSSKDGASISMRSTKVLEVDAEKLLIMYQPLAETLKTQLPSYIKVTLSIDKTALSNLVKDDPSMLIDSPELLHWVERESITLR